MTINKILKQIEFPFLGQYCGNNVWRHADTTGFTIPELINPKNYETWKDVYKQFSLDMENTIMDVSPASDKHYTILLIGTPYDIHIYKEEWQLYTTSQICIYTRRVRQSLESINYTLPNKSTLWIQHIEKIPTKRINLLSN